MKGFIENFLTGGSVIIVGSFAMVGFWGICYYLGLAMQEAYGAPGRNEIILAFQGFVALGMGACGVVLVARLGRYLRGRTKA